VPFGPRASCRGAVGQSRRTASNAAHTQEEEALPTRPTHRTTGLVALGLAVMAGVFLLNKPTATADARAQASATAVATVNMFEVVRALDEFRQVQERLAGVTEQRQSEINDLTGRIDGKQQELDQLSPESPAYDQLDRELKMLRAEREARGAILGQFVAEDNARALTELYEKGIQAVQDVAERDGWDVVLHTGQRLGVPRNPGVNANQAVPFVEDWIQSRRVIYSGPGVDITQDVVQLMNNRFAAPPTP